LVDYLDHLELTLCLRVNALSRREIVWRLFSVVSWLGNYPAWVAFGFAVASRRHFGTVSFAIQALATAFTGILIYKMLRKRLVRERPYVTYGEIVCGTPPLDRYSFPSGHTLHAMSLTILYGAYDPAMLVVMVPFAALVAASRIVLGLHYPSDVFVGGLLGALLATASLAVWS
jgi:undecaprenyl-diphosphatase